MKKKFFLLLVMVTMLTCVLAISVSASSEIPDFTDVIDVTTVGEGVVEQIDVSSVSTLEAVVNDNMSRVLLVDANGNYVTYLSKYVITTAKTGAGDYGMNFKFDALNDATGKGYSSASVVRFEIPEGVERMYSATLSGCSNLLSIKCGSTFWVLESGVFKTANCPSLKVIDFSASTKTTIKTTVTSVFANNSSIEEVRFPKGLVEMGSSAFHNDSSLKRVYIPSTFTKTTSIVNKTVDKSTFFYTGDMATAKSVFPGMLPTSYTMTLEYVDWDPTKSDDYYVELAENHSSTYVIYIVCNYSGCNAFYDGEHVKDNNPCVINCERCSMTGIAEKNPVHSESIDILYANGYHNVGAKITSCTNEGCAHSTTEETPALFICLGYSAPEDGRGGIAIGYTVNNVAIKEYTEATGETLKYGVFAVLQDRLGNNDVFSEDGTAADGVINAEITNYEFVAFEIKIIGFTDTQKDVKLAMGAYVAVTDGETTEYSYMQGGEPNENEKYCFVSYNDIVGTPSTDEEVTQ